MRAKEQFVSESLIPDRGTFAARAMGRGEPGLPTGFSWRGQHVAVVAELERWKASAPEGHRAGNEVYLRRHYYRLRMSNGQVWTVYFTRRPSSGTAARQRWFLYTISNDNAAD